MPSIVTTFCGADARRCSAHADQNSYDTETPQQMMFGHGRLRFPRGALPILGVVPTQALQDLSK